MSVYTIVALIETIAEKISDVDEEAILDKIAFDEQVREIIAEVRVGPAKLLIEQIRIDAAEASMQAAFWRNRAIGMGAQEDEYRRHMAATRET
jgi:hypothetical protein